MKLKKLLSIVVSASLAVSSMTLSSFASNEKQLVDTVIFSGESTIAKSWMLGPQIQTANGNGDFDPSDITAGGYFTIDYTGTEGAVYLAFAEWNTGTWASVNTPNSTTATATGYTSVFNYDTCLAEFQAQKKGTIELMDIHAIAAGTTNSNGTTTITNISWHGYSTEVDLGEKATILYKGSPSAASRDACLKFLYTKHVGGEWDASQMNAGSYFYAEYNGAEGGLNICLQSHSGGSRWAALTPDETGKLDDGRWYSKYNYDQIVKKYGTNFARLDQIQARTTTSEEVTLRRIAYVAGEGDPVDTTDGTWDRPDTGIAFIGDSIVENPHVDTDHLKAIDWNGILGRTDCVNYGIGGQTTKECAARIDEIAKKNYDKVVMLCGINDIGRNYTNEQIAANYQTMFDALKAKNPDVEIFLMSVLPTTPVFYTQAQDMIIDLNKTLKTLADKTENVTFINIHSTFYDASTGYCKNGLTFDGLHPNLDGYALIADILNPYLNGTDMTIYYQTRNDNTEIRFVAEVNIEAAQAAVTATEETLAARSDNANNYESVYGQKTILKAYKSLIANGEKVTAHEGKCYMISTTVSGISEGDKVKGLFTLDEANTSREVKFGSSSTETGSRVIWEGSGNTGKWENNVDLGVANIHDAEAGGVLTIEFTSTSAQGRSKLQVVTSQNPWTTLSGADGISASGGKLEITLTAEQAQQLVDATSLMIGGQAAIITKVSYTAPEDVVPPELSDMPELAPIPEGATLLWEGEGDVGKWGDAVKFEGFTNVPDAVAGGKLVFDYFATGTETQLAPAVQIGDELTWTQIPNPNGNTWFDATNNKLVITLNEEQASLYADSKQAWVGGKNAIVRRVYYAPADVVVDDSSSGSGVDTDPPTDGTLIWEKTNQRTGNSASLDWTIGNVNGYEKIVAYATFEGTLMTSSGGGTRVTITARSSSAKVADIGTYLFSKGTSAIIAEIPVSTLNGYVKDGASLIRFALAGADKATEHILNIQVYGIGQGDTSSSESDSSSSKPDSSTTDPVSGEKVLWEGSGDIGVWGKAVKLEGFTNIPTAKAGDKLVFEYTATGTPVQLSPAVQIGQTMKWTQILDSNGNNWFDTEGGKCEIILNAEQADLFVKSKQAHIGGQNAIVTKITYVPFSDESSDVDSSSVAEESSSTPDDSSTPVTERQKVAFIGDSICQMGDWATLFPNADTANFGVGGNTSTQVLERFSSAYGDYDKLFIICGVNDWSVSGWKNGSYSGSMDNYKQMFELAKENMPDIQIYVTGILPTCGQYTSYIEYGQSAAYNAKLSALADQYDYVTFIGNECWNALIDETTGYGNENYYRDGLHPNATGYNKLKAVMEPYV